MVEAVAFQVDAYGLRSARRFLDAIDQLSDHLANSPFMGRPIVNAHDNTDYLRCMRADSCFAIYRVHQGYKQVAPYKLFTATSELVSEELAIADDEEMLALTACVLITTRQHL